MPSYAILGATGSTGSSLLTILSRSPDNKINIYVRSQARLLTQFPTIANNKKVTIFEGDIRNVSLISSCVKDVDAVFATVATNQNAPGIRIAQDTANSLIASFCLIRSRDAAAKIPRLLFLSSASLNPTMIPHNTWTSKFVWQANSHIYKDLEHAEACLRLHRDWLTVVFVEPGALVIDKQVGHEVSSQLKGAVVSYADLAAGMIEIAGGNKYDWTGVTVNSIEEVKFPPRIMLNLFANLWAGLFSRPS